MLVFNMVLELLNIILVVVLIELFKVSVEILSEEVYIEVVV